MNMHSRRVGLPVRGGAALALALVALASGCGRNGAPASSGSHGGAGKIAVVAAEIKALADQCEFHVHDFPCVIPC